MNSAVGVIAGKARGAVAFCAALAFAGCSLGGTSPVGVSDGPAAVSFARAAANRIASLAIHPSLERLPLGQTMRFEVVARNSAGSVIKGRYDRPIALLAGGLTLSSYSVVDSSQGANLYASWASGVAGSAAATLEAKAGNAKAVTYVQPGTGFAYFTVGTGAGNASGFQIVGGPDGDLYFGTIGSCRTARCTPAGAIGRYDPVARATNEIALPSEVLGVLFTSDGALWFTGGSGHELYRMPPSAFSSGSLRAMQVPAPRPGATYTPRMLAQDDDGNVWFGDGAGGRMLEISASGPYESSAIHAFTQPRGPRGTPQKAPWVNGVAFANGTLAFADENNGAIDVVDTDTGKTSRQTILPQQRRAGSSVSVQPRFLIGASSGMLVSFLGVPRDDALSHGGIDRFGESSISPLALPESPAGELPDSLSSADSLVYYNDAGMHAVGVVNEENGRTRLVPTIPLASIDAHQSPNGIAAMPDGTAWFTCAGSSNPSIPLCIGHTVYLDDWTIFPGPEFTLGSGRNAAQVVGIMENPSQDSGPFTARAQPSIVCGASAVDDHDFAVTGHAEGRCTVTVRDARGRSESITATVTPGG